MLLKSDSSGSSHLYYVKILQGSATAGAPSRAPLSSPPPFSSFVGAPMWHWGGSRVESRQWRATFDWMRSRETIARGFSSEERNQRLISVTSQSQWSRRENFTKLGWSCFYKRGWEAPSLIRSGNYTYIIFTKFYLPCDSEGTFWSSSQAVTRPLVSHAVLEASHCPCYCWTFSREAVNTNFYSFVFPTGGGARVTLTARHYAAFTMFIWRRSFWRLSISLWLSFAFPFYAPPFHQAWHPPACFFTALACQAFSNVIIQRSLYIATTLLFVYINALFEYNEVRLVWGWTASRQDISQLSTTMQRKGIREAPQLL